MCQKDLENVTEMETMEVTYRETAMKPAVNVEIVCNVVSSVAADAPRFATKRIAVSNLPRSNFPEGAVALPECRLRNLIRSFRNLGQDGDRRGREAYEKKRKSQVEVENREYKVAISYTTLVLSMPESDRVKLTITLLPNAAGEAVCRHDPKGRFRKMTNDEITAFIDSFMAQCAHELQDVFDEEYKWALEHHEKPDYLNPHVLDMDHEAV